MKIFFAILLVLLLFISCKKEENQAPIIVIENPLENTHISSIDSFLVNGKITDDKEIKWVNISIVNPNLIPVSSVYSFSPNTKAVEINQLVEISNIHLEGGVYFLLVSAGDEEETTRNYTKLIISAIEKELTGIWTLTSESGNSIIRKYHQGIIEEFLNISKDCRDISINSYSAQLQLLTTDGNLQSYQLEDKTLFWEKPNLNNFQYPYYGSLECNSNLSFVSATIGDIYGIDENGMIKRTLKTSDNSYRPSKFYFHWQYAIIESIPNGSIPKRIELVFATSGISMQYHSMEMEITGFSSFDENRVMIWGNTAGKMKVCTLNIALQHLDEVTGFPNQIVKSVAMVSSEKHFFLCGNTIYIYRPSSFSISEFLSDIEADFIKYESITNSLFVIMPNNISVYNATAANLMETIEISQPIIDLEFSYNK
jgi:hypothetical protein